MEWISKKNYGHSEQNDMAPYAKLVRFLELQQLRVYRTTLAKLYCIEMSIKFHVLSSRTGNRRVRVDDSKEAGKLG